MNDDLLAAYKASDSEHQETLFMHMLEMNTHLMKTNELYSQMLKKK